MEQNIQKCIVAYFKYLEKHNLLCQNIDESCVSILNKLLVKARNLDLIKKAEIDVYKKLDNIKERILRAILVEIDELMEFLNNLLTQLEKSTTELRSKLIEFEKNVDGYDFPVTSDIVKGTPLQPKLSRLLEAANDSWVYYHGHLSSLKIDLKCCNFNMEKDIQEILNRFTKNKPCEDVINSILMLTQFCSQNNLSSAI